MSRVTVSTPTPRDKKTRDKNTERDRATKIPRHLVGKRNELGRPLMTIRHADKRMDEKYKPESREYRNLHAVLL